MLTIHHQAVFLIQCAVSAANILAAVLLVANTDDRDTSPALVGAYACAYLVGSVVSALVLRKAVGGLSVAGGSGWPAYLGRLLLAALAAAGLALGVRLLLPDLPDDPSTVRAVLELALLSGVAVGFFLLLARVLKITEVTSVISTVLRRRQPTP